MPFERVLQHRIESQLLKDKEVTLLMLQLKETIAPGEK